MVVEKNVWERITLELYDYTTKGGVLLMSNRPLRH
jgi:hypothetical protein